MAELANNDLNEKTRQILAQDSEVSDEAEGMTEFQYSIENQMPPKSHKGKAGTETAKHTNTQMSLFDAGAMGMKTDDIILELHDLDLSSTTPIDAMNILYRMQTKLRDRF